MSRPYIVSIVDDGCLGNQWICDLFPDAREKAITVCQEAYPGLAAEIGEEAISKDLTNQRFFEIDAGKWTIYINQCQLD